VQIGQKRSPAGFDFRALRGGLPVELPKLQAPKCPENFGTSPMFAETLEAVEAIEGKNTPQSKLHAEDGRVGADTQRQSE
jgi:hypothetical protein